MSIWRGLLGLPACDLAHEKTAQAVNAYRANFAKPGNPNDGVLPDWLCCRGADDQLMCADLVEQTAHP